MCLLSVVDHVFDPMLRELSLSVVDHVFDPMLRELSLSVVDHVFDPMLRELSLSVVDHVFDPMVQKNETNKSYKIAIIVFKTFRKICFSPRQKWSSLKCPKPISLKS